MGLVGIVQNHSHLGGKGGLLVFGVCVNSLTNREGMIGHARSVRQQHAAFAT